MDRDEKVACRLNLTGFFSPVMRKFVKRRDSSRMSEWEPSPPGEGKKGINGQIRGCLALPVGVSLGRGEERH
ncbi:hypothetical protein ES702_02101 [subsurface metagenome]